VTFNQILTLLCKDVYESKKSRVDDDDGHFIVVPDTDLTRQCELRPTVSALQAAGQTG
jgi:hypothetical protein